MKFKVSSQAIEITEYILAVSGSSGIYEAEFEFTSDWDSWAKTAEFKNESVAAEVPILNGKASVPFAVLSPGGYFSVGVYGSKTVGSSNLKKPTVWTTPIRISEGCSQGSNIPDPSQSVYDEIMEAVEDAVETAESVEERADAGEFNGEDGTDGIDGIGIASITKTGTSGNVDTYTITFDDATTTTFTVTNGIGITGISKTSTVGNVDTYTITLSDGTTSTFTVTNGTNGVDGTSPVANVSKSGNTATITITDLEGTTTATITDGTNGTDGTDGEDGRGITSISKTSTSGLVDTYTISFTDGSTTTFTVTNGEDGTDGRSITSVTKTGTVGLVDTYEITFSDSTTSTFTVTNGAKGDTGDEAEILSTEYGTSASSSTQPTSWQSVIPTVIGGNFLWTRYTWNNGEYTYQCTRYGVDGTGTGDMTIAVYDPSTAVAQSGGIQAFVNSSVATNTANYISNQGQPFTSVEQLEAYSGTVTNNDYAFVTGTDAQGNTYYDRYKATVSGSTVTWANEFRLNNSSFTSAQWQAISSGITSTLVSSYSTHIGNNEIHVTSQNKSDWNGKQDAISSTTDLTVKTLTGGLTYLTSAPNADNTDGIKIVVLNSIPSNKYNGYLYLITGA